MKVRVLGIFNEKRNGRFRFKPNVHIPAKVELAWYRIGDSAIVDYVTKKFDKKYGSGTYKIYSINRYIDEQIFLWDLHNMVGES